MDRIFRIKPLLSFTENPVHAQPDVVFILPIL